MPTKPIVLAFTPGEPTGIGPDLAVLIAQQQFNYCIAAIADPELLTQRARLLGLNLSIKDFDGTICAAGELQVLPVLCNQPSEPGKLDTANAEYVLETIKLAAQGCLKHQFDALVTGPIQKSIINDAGIAFSGHTEFLAQLCGNRRPVMMLANRKLKVALVTTHVPLNKVSESVTSETLRQVIEITENDLKNKFGIQNPRLAVCGLNPHAGENGHMGNEEIEIITPVIEELKSMGINLTGPLPADTAFTMPKLNQTDVVIAMYHDQGLPVVKALGFGETVNVTLGLPIIRTSVDHGTALSLAGTKSIQVTSLQAAFEMAFDMANSRVDS